MPSPPSAFTSSNAAVYSGLSRAGGGGARYWLRDAQHEGSTSAPVRAEGDRDQADRVLAPDAGRRRRGRSRSPSAARGAASHRRRAARGWRQRRAGRARRRARARSRSLTRARSSASGASKSVGLGGEHRDQRVMRRLGDGRVEGGAARRGAQAGVAPVAARDRVDRVEDRDLHDRDRAARAARARAAGRRSGLARRRRRVVEAARVDRDAVPAPHGICVLRELRVAAEVGGPLEAGSEGVAELAGGVACEGGPAQREREADEPGGDPIALLQGVHLHPPHPDSARATAG